MTLTVAGERSTSLPTSTVSHRRAIVLGATASLLLANSLVVRAQRTGEPSGVRGIPVGGHARPPGPAVRALVTGGAVLEVT